MKFLILLALLGFVVAVVHKIPLTRFESTMVEKMKDGTWKNHIMKKDVIHATAHKSGKKYTQKVYENESGEYVANITVGTPPQTFRVLLDTGTADFWVPDVKCKDQAISSCDQCLQYRSDCQFLCDDASRSNAPDKGTAESVSPINLVSACHGKHKFNQSKSNTYTVNGKPLDVSYGNAYVLGFLGQDTLRFGESSDSLTVPNVTFGQVTHLSSDFEGRLFDGILGLAFPSLASNDVTPPFFEAINQGLVDPLLSVYLPSSGLDHGGQFTYGETDTDNCGPVIAYENLSSATNFQFSLKSVKFESYSSTVGWETASDTGYSSIIGPYDSIEKIAALAKARFDYDYGCYVVDCEAQLGNLELAIGDNTYSIGPKNYIFEIESGSCCLALATSSNFGLGPAWILGYPFLRSYCNIYDYGNKRIGFAQPKRND